MALAYQEYYTVKDYKTWEGSWELIGGMPYAMSPSPSVTHQAVSINVATQIKMALDAGNRQCGKCQVLMETDWQVSNDTVVRPDVRVICKDVCETVTVVPELIVEVVLSSSTKRDEVIKFELYQKEGVGFYILLYPSSKTVKIYKNSSEDFVLLSNNVECFELGLCSLPINFDEVWR